MENEANVGLLHGIPAAIHDLSAEQTIAPNENVIITEVDFSELFGASDPDEAKDRTEIPAAELGMITTTNEEETDDGTMEKSAAALDKLEHQVGHTDVDVQHEEPQKATPSPEMPEERSADTEEAAAKPAKDPSIDDPIPSIEVEDDLDSLFGDNLGEELAPIGLGATGTNLLDDPNQDGGKAYESDQDAFKELDDEDETTQISLAAYLAQQERAAKKATVVRRGAFDVGSENDSSSSEDEGPDEDENNDDDGRVMQPELEMQAPIDALEYAEDAHWGDLGCEEIDGRDDEIFVSPGSERHKTQALFVNSEPDEDDDIDAANLSEVLTFHQPQLEEVMEVDTNHGDGEVTGAKQVYEALPSGIIRTLRHSSEDLSEEDDEDQRSSNEDSSDDDDDDSKAMEMGEEPHLDATVQDNILDDKRCMEDIMNDLAKELPKRIPTPTPAPHLPRVEANKSKKRSLAEMRSNRQQGVPASLAVTNLGFVPTRARAINRGARGVPRRPDMDEARERNSSASPSQGLPMPAPTLPVSSLSLQMPSLSLPMPSVSLPMPSTGRPLASMNPAQQQSLPAPQPASIDDAQAAMLSSMTAAKRSGLSLFDAPRVPSTSKDPVSKVSTSRRVSILPGAFNSSVEQGTDSAMEDYSWMNQCGDDADTEIDVYLDLTRQIRSLKRKLKDENLSASEKFDLLRMKEELRKLEIRRSKSRTSDDEEVPRNDRGEYNRRHAESSEDDDHSGDERQKRRRLAEENAQKALDEAIQRENEQPTQITSSSRRRRPKNAREVRLRDAEKQADREERAFFREGKASKPKKTNSEAPAEDSQDRKKLFKNRLASHVDDSRDDVMAKVLTFINPNANAIEQRLEQGEVPAEPEIRASTKQQQLADLLITIPTDFDTRTARSQRAALNRASKSFGFGRVKAENGKWLLRGMHSALYHHQLEGADWMVSRELAAKEPKGGILADAMGLGKTVTTLAAIVGNPPDKKSIKNGQKATLVVVPASLLKQWESEVEKHVKSEALSKVQTYKKSSSLKLRVIEDCDIVLTTYAEVLNSWNIKMTESETQSADILGVERWRELHRDELGLLHQINWYRIVLDEAHFIKNWKSSSAQACFHLNAEYRWCLTGTPMMNSLDELYPYFKFFRLSWTSTFKDFKKGFGDPNAADATKRLSVMMRMVMKRRTFGDTMLGRPLIALPLPQAELKIVKLSKEEVVIYRLIEDKFREGINVQLRQETGAIQRNYAHMLSQLLRLRQAAAHPFLLEWVFKDIFDASELQFLKRKFQRLGRSKLPIYDQVKEWILPAGDGDSAIPFGKSNFGNRFEMGVFLDTVSGKAAIKRTGCAFCHDFANNPQVANCHHIFCKDCIEGQTMAQQAEPSVPQYACPQCDVLVGEWSPYRDVDKESSSNASRRGKNSRNNKKDNSWKPPVKSQWLEMCENNPQLLLPSSKTIAVKAQVVKWLSEAPEDKILIFTQFRAMARIIGLMCTRENIEHVYFTGDMSHKQRENSIERFHADKKIKVMIAILKCGGVGLNLNCANRVISIDPWWNHSVEQQAFGRVFRLGQAKVTHFVRLFSENTVDYRILDLQKDKIAAIDAAMLPGKLSNLPPLSLEEIAGLFGQVVEEDGGVLQVRRDYDENDADVEDDAQEGGGQTT